MPVHDRPCARDPLTDATVGATGSSLRGDSRGSPDIGDFDGDGVRELATYRRLIPLDRREHGPDDGVLVDLDLADLAGGDFDGDGQDDLALLRGDQVSLVLGPIGGPVPDLGAVLISPGAGISDLRSGQVDADPTTDLLLSLNDSFDATYRIYAAPDWTTAVATVDEAEQYPGAVLADADGDGRDDLWTSRMCVYPSPVPEVGALPAGCVDDGTDDRLLGAPFVADVDGDGTSDAAVADDTSARVFLGPFTTDRSIADASWARFEVPTGSVRQVAVERGSSGVRLVVVGDEVWTVPIASGTLDPSDAALIRGSGSLGVLLAEDLDGDGAGDLMLNDPTAAFGADPFTGALWVSWGE